MYERITTEVVAARVAQTRAGYARANAGRGYDRPGTLRTLFRRIAAR
jgi:hypothetical protein